MKKLIALPLLIGAIATGCATIESPRPGEPDFQRTTTRKVPIVIEVEGTAGQRVEASLDLDGESQEMVVTIPAEIPVEANIVTGTFRKASGRGAVSLSFVKTGGHSSVGFQGIKRAGDVVRFWYHNGEGRFQWK